MCAHAFERRSLSIYELEPTHALVTEWQLKRRPEEFFISLFEHDLLIPCCEKFAFQITSLVKSMKEKS